MRSCNSTLHTFGISIAAWSLLIRLTTADSAYGNTGYNGYNGYADYGRAQGAFNGWAGYGAAAVAPAESMGGFTQNVPYASWSFSAPPGSTATAPIQAQLATGAAQQLTLLSNPSFAVAPVPFRVAQPLEWQAEYLRGQSDLQALKKRNQEMSAELAELQGGFEQPIDPTAQLRGAALLSKPGAVALNSALATPAGASYMQMVQAPAVGQAPALLQTPAAAAAPVQMAKAVGEVNADHGHIDSVKRTQLLWRLQTFVVLLVSVALSVAVVSLFSTRFLKGPMQPNDEDALPQVRKDAAPRMPAKGIQSYGAMKQWATNARYSSSSIPGTWVEEDD